MSKDEKKRREEALRDAIFHPTGASALRHRDRDSFFVNIQANKSGMFHQARLLCMRLCAGQPAYPRTVAYRMTGHLQAKQS